MKEFFESISSLEGVGLGLAWTITACLLIAGFVGCILPFVPGHLLLLMAALGHRLMLGAEGSGLSWWSLGFLALMAIISQVLETMSGAAGAKRFGSTRWGVIGALVGGVLGMFFMPIGLLAGPLLGAIVCELAFAREQMVVALRSGVGSLVGTVAGMGIKLIFGMVMILWFFLDVFLIG
jgi:uncharacterized protein YqgC (DUF456 family)